MTGWTPTWWGFRPRLLRDVYQGLPGAGPGLEFRVWSALDGELPVPICTSAMPGSSPARATMPTATSLDPGAARLDPACPRCRRQAGRGLLRPPGDRPGAGGEVMKSTKGWGWGIGPSHAGAATLDGAWARDHPDPGQPPGSGGAAATGATRLAGNDFVPISCFAG